MPSSVPAGITVSSNGTVINGNAAANHIDATADITAATGHAPLTGATISGGGGNDGIVGTGYADRIDGGAGSNTMIGGGGSDTFLVKAATAIGATDTIYDFGGAGGYAAANNDFLAFTGYAAGSTLVALNGGNASAAFTPSAANPQAKLFYYAVEDASGNVLTKINIVSTDGKALTRSDYNFYK